MACDFDKIKQNNHVLYIRQAFRNETFEQALLDGEEQLLQRYQLTRVHSSKFTRVYKSKVDFNGVETGLYLKWYLYRSAWDFIKHLCRPSRAKRAFRAKLMLAENNFEAPTIVAIGECRSTFFCRASFLVTLEIENVKPARQLLLEGMDSTTTEQLRAKRRQLRAFGQAVGRMHNSGIFQGDLRLGNPLARNDGTSWRFFFLDNERTRKFRRLPHRLRVKNLVQVNMFPPLQMSNTDRMRFFTAYAAENKMTGRRKEKLIRETVEKTRQRLAKKLLYPG